MFTIYTLSPNNIFLEEILERLTKYDYEYQIRNLNNPDNISSLIEFGYGDLKMDESSFIIFYGDKEITIELNGIFKLTKQDFESAIDNGREIINEFVDYNLDNLLYFNNAGYINKLKDFAIGI